jgi:hypothetical protein
MPEIIHRHAIKRSVPKTGIHNNSGPCQMPAPIHQKKSKPYPSRRPPFTATCEKATGRFTPQKILSRVLKAEKYFLSAKQGFFRQGGKSILLPRLTTCAYGATVEIVVTFKTS